MIKYFQKAFKITSENIILATPLILFLFLFNLYLSLTKGLSNGLFSLLLLVITVFFMLSAFFAGWFFMVKKAVKLDSSPEITEEEKAKASFNLLKEIPIGVGEYFFSFLGAVLLYITIFAITAIISYKIGIHYIGKINLDIAQLKLAMASSSAMKSLITSMSTDELIRLNKWNFLLLGSTIGLSFITLLWPAQIIYKDKNPFFAFFNSLKFILKHPIETIILFVYISIINFVVSMVNTVSMINQILYFISLLAYFYFIVYIVVLIFLYYDGKDSEISKKENHSNSGTDSVR